MDYWILQELYHRQGVQELKSLLLLLRFIVTFFIIQFWKEMRAIEVIIVIVVLS